MVQRSYPFVGGPTTDAEFSQMFASLFPSSVLGKYGSTALKVAANSSGMKVTVPAGQAFVRGHCFLSDATETLTIASNSSGSARIDTVVLHLEYGTVKSITLKVIQGTPAATPTPPALTQTPTGIYQFPLADVLVAAGAVTIAANNVTDRRIWWGLELMKSFGLVPASVQPGTGEAFVWLRTA